MYALIDTCGKQYKVREGEIVFFEKLDQMEGSQVVFDKVVTLSDEESTQVGTPYIDGASVTGKVLTHGKDRKILVFKYKAKKNYRRMQGHRQAHTKVQIEKILTSAQS
ncbi:MAG TPA: 50S ribosomal protein L21 [Clostridiales bacterium]|nr:50S ribosomal protein L21 [Clostridiales bacterium]